MTKCLSKNVTNNSIITRPYMGGGNKAEETERLASTPADSRPKVNCKTQALLTDRTDVQGEVSDVPDEQQSCCCAASCRVTRAFLLS